MVFELLTFCHQYLSFYHFCTLLIPHAMPWKLIVMLYFVIIKDIFCAKSPYLWSYIKLELTLQVLSQESLTGHHPVLHISPIVLILFSILYRAMDLPSCNIKTKVLMKCFANCNMHGRNWCFYYRNNQFFDCMGCFLK